VWKTTELAVAAAVSIDPSGWSDGLEELMARVAGRFARVETRATCRRMLIGMVSELASKNCWTLAERVGDRSPHVMQHFLSRASWDDDSAGADLRAYAVHVLGETDAVLVLDETGDLKKGAHTVGVQRQYTGTAGRIENAQVAVYLGYSTDRGYTLIDRELYLPRSWAGDPARRARAGVPDDVEFASKGELGRGLLARFLDAGGRAAWLTGDEVYGDDPALRRFAESRELDYVMAIGCHRHVTTAHGRTARADEVVASLPARKWHTITVGDGAKGPRRYDWARVALRADPDAEPGHRWLLARRNRTTGEMAYYRCFSTHLPRLGELARVAARRWSIEVNFQHAKTLVGLDQHQVRTWRSWRRWTLLGMLALTLLTALSTTAPAPPDNRLIPLTRNEIRHLISQLIIAPTQTIDHITTWSLWRRRHQHQARTGHYQRRPAQTP
jgi:SRSO17 transposase